MSVIPMALLSPCDLALLGNNLSRRGRRRPPRRRPAVLSAVNRSLAPLGERVAALHPSARNRSATA